LAEYERPYLYPKQAAAIFSPKRWSLCEASTKSGKTVASIARIVEWGLQGAPGQNYWWVAPISPQARIAFSRIKQYLTPGTFVARETPEPSLTLISGPVLTFKSADNPDSLYGEDVYGVIIDEASRSKDTAWHAVRSTLTATRGPAVIIGNVKGRRNWFWEFCRRVEAGGEPNGHYMKITWRDAVAANVLDLEEIEDARRNLPENVFRELYEAEASDDGANPFGETHILACVSERLSDAPPVAFGIDLAKRQDWLVVIGLDASGRACVFQRWRDVPWRESIRRIHSIVGEDVPALVDSTGVGDPVLEELQVGHGNFRGYVFSTVSKQRLMEGLAVSIQGREISYPDGPIKNELLTFEYETSRTGVRYSAPMGYNDDCVCSLALARQQLTETAPGAAIIEFYQNQSELAAARARSELAKDSGLVSAGNVSAEFVQKLRGLDDDLILSRAETIDNELTALYNETMGKYNAPSRVCARCVKAIPETSYLTDGVLFWHQGCA